MNEVLDKRLSVSKNEAFEEMQKIMNGYFDTDGVLEFLCNNDLHTLSEEVLQGYRSAVIASGLYTLDTSQFEKPVVDIVGTGGDGRSTANISTFASLICAATDLVNVAKYGNRSASGICGSMDIFENLGIKIELSENEVIGFINNFGIAPLYARFIYPGGKYVAEARSQFKLPTVFNLLFSTSRPFKGNLKFIFGCALESQLKTVEKFFISDLNTRCLLVNGHDSTDEISISGNGKTNYSLIEKGSVKRGIMNCNKLFGISPGDLTLLQVSSKEEAVDLFSNALDPSKSGKKIGALRNAGVVNAAAALFIALENGEDNPAEINKYISCSRDALASGKVLELVKDLKTN